MNITELKEYIVQLRSLHSDLVVVIYGPTATGKSGLSLRLADLFAQENQGIEIISSDSRQVYRSMDIGTDKIWIPERKRIPHYGIDLISPDGSYTAHQRQQDTKQWITDIQSRNHIPFIVWGTGLYIDTIYKNFHLPEQVEANRERREELERIEEQNPGYLRDLLNKVDTSSAQGFHPKNTRYLIRAIEIYEQTGIPKSVLVQEKPVDQPLLMISLKRDWETTKSLITTRVEEMLQNGLIEEVQWLLTQWYSPDLQSMNGIGYRQTVQWLSEKSNNREDLIHTIAWASVQYAKRQRTWFRRYEKDARENTKHNVFYQEIIL